MILNCVMSDESTAAGLNIIFVEKISTHEQLRNKGVWALGGGKLIRTKKKMGHKARDKPGE